MNKDFSLPETGFIRLSAVLRLIPIGKTSWWNGVRKGLFPKSVKLGTKTTAWRAEDIKTLIEKLSHARPSSFSDNVIHLRALSNRKKSNKQKDLASLVQDKGEKKPCKD